MVNRLLTIRETWVRSLGWEEPLEKEMATHPSILVWRIPWTEQPCYEAAVPESASPLPCFTVTSSPGGSVPLLCGRDQWLAGPFVCSLQKTFP